MNVLTVKKFMDRDFSGHVPPRIIREHRLCMLVNSRGLGWFYPANILPSAELPDEEYPIILMTGRILYHYTTRAMTGKTPELMEIEGKSFIEMNIVDADKLGIKNGDKVRVSSRRGSIESTARVGTKTSPGELDAIPLPGWKCKLADQRRT